MQGLFRNPLADPGIIGVSAGASLGVVLVITQFAALSDLWLIGPLGVNLWRVPVAAFVGAMMAALVVYAAVVAARADQSRGAAAGGGRDERGDGRDHVGAAAAVGGF